jgi:membrane fusion protein (multidrug efflux system)
MATPPEAVESSASEGKPAASHNASPKRHDYSKLQRFLVPAVVVLLAIAVLITITRNWNAYEGGKAEQVTDDAYVRADLTPLSTKVAGLVRAVHVSDFQAVHKGDLIVELQDDDYRAQVDQAKAAVEAARAAIENNRRQRDLQDAKIAKAIAVVDQAKSQIAAAEAGKAAVGADMAHAKSERRRQEALYQTRAATQQKVESAVADEERFSAQFASRDADLVQARTLLLSNQLSAEAERRTKAVLESQEAQLQADLHAKQAALAAALVNLGYTKIYAPDEGTVGERQVRPGQLVSPGTQVISFVSGSKWIQANYRETQLTHVKVGDAAEVRIDQYPGQVFRGKVLEIAPASGSQFALLPPDNATGNFTKVVQRIPVKIAFDDSTATTKLRPGLSVIATVRTKR